MGRLFGSILLFLVILAALALAVIVGLPLIPLERLAPEIEQRASTFLDRDVSIGGSLRLTALPSPRLRIEDVSLANWEGGQTQTMASVDELDLVVALAPLLNREIHVERLILRRPQLNLEQRGKAANWQFDLGQGSQNKPASLPAQTQAQPQTGSAFSLSDIRLKGVEVIDGSAGLSTGEGSGHRIDNLRLAAQMDGLDQPFSTEIAASWQGNQLGFSGSLTTLANILGGQAFHVDGQVRLNDHQANARGTLAIDGAPRLTGVELSASGPSIASLLTALGLPLPVASNVLGAYDIQGTIDYANQTADLQGLSATVGDLSLSGDILASFLGGFFAQTRAPIQLSVRNVDQWVQALPNPPIAPNPGVLTSLNLSGSMAVSQTALEVFDASIALNDITAQGAVQVNFGPDVDGFVLDTLGPLSLRVGNLDQWLGVIDNPAIPRDPQLFSALQVQGEISATPRSLSLTNAELTLADLSFAGSMQTRFGGPEGLRYASNGPLRLSVRNSNRWLDLIPNRPLPQSPQLFGALNLAGGLSGTADSVALDNVQIALGDIQAAGSLAAQFNGGTNVQLQSRGPLRLSGPSLDLIATTFGVELPRVNPNAYGAYTAQTEVLFDGQRLALTNLSAQMDQTSIAGRVALDLSAQPLAFDINLSAGGLDTRPYLDLQKRDPNQRKAIAAADPNAPWGRVPLRFDFLQAAQGRAVLRLDSVTTGMVDLGASVAQVEWQNAVLTANIQGAQLYGGQALGQVQLTNPGGTSGLAANLDLGGVDAGQVMADLLGLDQLQGVTNLNLAVATQGGVLQDWMSSLNGRFTAQLDPLAVLGLDFLASLDNLQRGQFAAVQGANASTRFKQVGMSGTIENGIARIDDLRADLNGYDVSGLGTINIGLQRLDYRLELMFNDQVPIPLIIKGPWLKPAVRIDSDRVLAFALDNPQLFLDMLPAEWNLQGLLPQGASLNNIQQQASQALAQESARLQALAQAEANRVAQQAAIEANRLAQQAAAAAQAEANRIAQQIADQATAAARQQAQNLANQIGGQVGQQLQNQATHAGQDALGNFLGGLLGN